MTTAMKALTARIWHTCSTCTGKVIAPGHRYLLHTELPALTVAKECVGCAQDRDDFAPVQANACASYCCSLKPCALPHRHDNDHAGGCCVKPPASTPEEGAA